MKALSATLLLFLIQLAPSALSVPNPPSRPRAASSGPISVSLVRKRIVDQDSADNTDNKGVWAKNQREILRRKYGQDSSAKRSSGENL